MSRTGGASPGRPLVLALGVGLLVAACSSGGGAADHAGGTASGSPAGSPGAASAPSSGPTTSPSATVPPGSLTPVPARPRKTLPVAPPSATVTVGKSARAVLVASRKVTVSGRGPGELSGPGVALTLRVANGAGPALNLDAVTVSASVSGQEASASDASPAKPFSGSLAAGARAVGVYVFVLPSGVRGPMGVVVSLAPQLPVATFKVP